MEGIYQVTIQQVENGFLVRVGCKIFVCEEWAKIAEQLGAYFAGEETAFIKAQKDKIPQQADIPQPCDPTANANLGETVARG